jgi:hypothetical protein
MALAAATMEAAARMGTRAGQAFVDTGIPTRNPYDNGNTALAQLAAAWRRAYFAAAAQPHR